MNNKVEAKKYIKISCFVIIVFTMISSIFCYYQYRAYTQNFNEKLADIIEIISEKYPETDKSEIIESLNENESGKNNEETSTKENENRINSEDEETSTKKSENTFNSEEVETESKASNSGFFEKYGIDKQKNSAIIKNDESFKKAIIINASLMVLSSATLMFIYFKYNKKKNKDILEIEKYVEQINKGNYKLDIDNNTEDELSILKNEVYKVMIMLKESADNSLKDKQTLKSSLEDISHQLKTPLTSIMIATENLEDNPDLDIETREKFIKIIKKNTTNIRFLVQSILKLSQFDTNTVDFINKNVKIETIVKEAMENTENLCDLRNIKIEMEDEAPNATLYCDQYWQTEALTNIIKNAIEHANEKVKIKVTENNVYSEIVISNDGKEISKKDLPHIFERFYKGENANTDSVGIGLSLSKTIVESSNGKIAVTIKPNETKFTVRYFKTQK